MRVRIQQSAINLAQHIGYDSAGTVEFLVTPSDQQYYFLEVNPRIQVEHTISEEITGIDIVRSQILVALGDSLKSLGITQSRINSAPPRVSIQARICAEDPHKDNMLSVGKLAGVELPMGQGVRVDTWIHSDAVVLPHFDSLLAKVIVTAESFPAAIEKMKRALNNTFIHGVQTNRDFLLALIQDEQFQHNDTQDVTVLFLESRMAHVLENSKQVCSDTKMLSSERNVGTSAVAQPGSLQFKPGDVFNIDVSSLDKTGRSIKQVHSIKLQEISINDFPDNFSSTVEMASSSASGLGNRLQLKLSRRSAVADSALRRKAIGDAGEVACPISGMVTEVSVNVGDKIEAGQEVFVVSAMKMETVIKAHINGRVKAIYAKANELVDAGDLIVEIADLKESKL
jgi:pyruvate carboxylase